MQVFKVVKVTEKKLGLEFYLTKLMPVGLCQALTNYFGNTSYLYLTVAFIQMLKVRLINMPYGFIAEALRHVPNCRSLWKFFVGPGWYVCWPVLQALLQLPHQGAALCCGSTGLYSWQDPEQFSRAHCCCRHYRPSSPCLASLLLGWKSPLGG